jgi:hypothetical protein
VWSETPALSLCRPPYGPAQYGSVGPKDRRKQRANARKPDTAWVHPRETVHASAAAGNPRRVWTAARLDKVLRWTYRSYARPQSALPTRPGVRPRYTPSH